MDINARDEWLQNSKPLLTTIDVSELLGITPNHIYRMVSEKKLPSIKIGRYRRYRATEIFQWVEEKAGGRI